MSLTESSPPRILTRLNWHFKALPDRLINKRLEIHLEKCLWIEIEAIGDPFPNASSDIRHISISLISTWEEVMPPSYPFNDMAYRKYKPTSVGVRTEFDVVLRGFDVGVTLHTTATGRYTDITYFIRQILFLYPVHSSWCYSGLIPTLTVRGQWPMFALEYQSGIMERFPTILKTFTIR